MRINSSVQNEVFVRHLKLLTGRLHMAIVFLLASVRTAADAPQLASAAEPALPKLKTETQEAFERYVKLTEARNEEELKRGTGLLWVDGLPRSRAPRRTPR